MLPVLAVDEVFHVGWLDPSLKGENSYEGDSLSVSLDPVAWRALAQLGGSPIQLLRRPQGRFLDLQAVQQEPALLAEITSWASVRAYIEPTPVWRLWAYDSEQETDYYMEFDALGGLLAEAGAGPDASLQDAIAAALEEGRWITQAEGWRMLPAAMTRARHNSAESILALDLACLFWAEDTTTLDGAWWPGEEPARGCIFNRSLASWKVAEYEPPALSRSF